MAFEIERKYLVRNTAFKQSASSHYDIKQGFLNSHKERTVRVRMANGKGILTIKGKSSEDGLVRFEWETELTQAETESLLKLCEPGIIEKTRYIVQFGHSVFEVDEFHGRNKGLVIAEIELSHVDDTIEKPNWLGQEITGDIRYYNSQLAKRPFNEWN